MQVMKYVMKLVKTWETLHPNKIELHLVLRILNLPLAKATFSMSNK